MDDESQAVPPARFIEVGHCQLACEREFLAGDLFHSRSLDDGGRVVSVLADGLSSGVEAAVLASITASMALEYVEWNIDTGRAATILMNSLPVDPRRQISYSTFTIVDARRDGWARVFEHGNPPFMLIRDGALVPAAELDQRVHRHARWGNRSLRVSEFQSQVGDRLVLCSDGVQQSGMGSDPLPLGWGEEAAAEYLLARLAEDPGLSCRRLSSLLVHRALANDGELPGDDITCGIVHLRRPRVLYLLTGPPFDPARDREFARLARVPGVRKVVAGGTTSNILARELNLEVEMDLSMPDRDVPAPSAMAGVELVTEGCLTLAKAAEYLEHGPPPRRNAATRLVELLLDSDIIHFQVGTAVNVAHQDPALPVELDIRRNVIRRIAGLLEHKHLKQARITYY
jgi:hypothetical protein